MPDNHNQYCRDDWNMCYGDGPRGMGPNGDGCVCSLQPGDAVDRVKRAIQAAAAEPYRPDPPPILSAGAKDTYDRLVQADWDLGSLGGDHGVA